MRRARLPDRTVTMPPTPEHARFRPTVAPRFSPLPGSPDLVVIGAGAAGIAAARRGIARGLSVAVLEARGRVGGRAVTTSLRGHAVDLGADSEVLAGVEAAPVAIGLQQQGDRVAGLACSGHDAG